MSSEVLVTLEVEITSEEPQLVKSYGVEKIYEVETRCRTTKTKYGVVFLDFSNVLGWVPKFGESYLVSGKLRSVCSDNNKVVKVFLFVSSVQDSKGDYRNEVKIDCLELYEDATPRKSFNDDSVDITNFRVVAESSGGKAYIIPCCTWNNLAKLSKNLKKGQKISGSGCIQSRTSKIGRVYTEVVLSYLDII